MYEQFKNQFMQSISEHFSIDDMNYILEKLSITAHNFDISPKETSLISYNGDTIPALLKTYLVCKKMEGLSEQTLYNYGHYLKHFFQSIQKEPHQVTANDIRIFLYKYQDEKQISGRSLDKYRTYIASFYQWAVDEEYLDKNPSKSVKPIKYEIKPRQALTQLELEYLRTACSTTRELAIIEFLYSTGCRVSELTNVRISDIDWKEKTVVLLGKGKKYRTSYINAKAEVALKQYLQNRTDNTEYLFVSSRKPYTQLHKAGLERIMRNLSHQVKEKINKNITPHILRHTTATIALENGMPVEDISKLLGHSNISTTMIYAHTSQENVQSEHKKCVI